MIIDDDDDDREIFCEAVRITDSRVRCIPCGGGQEALNFLLNKKIHPDAIFLDLNMPLFDGRQCLQQLKSDKNLKNIPVIIYTTSKREEDADDLLSLGAAAFFTKPTSMDALVHAIRMTLEHQYQNLEAPQPKRLQNRRATGRRRLR